MRAPNNTNSIPTAKFIFIDARKTHFELTLQELESRNASFNNSKLNSKGKSVKIGIKNLIELLKDSVYPNKHAESMSMEKNEQLIFKSFTPTYLTATH